MDEREGNRIYTYGSGESNILAGRAIKFRGHEFFLFVEQEGGNT